MVVKDDLLEQVLLLTRQMREQAQQAAWEEAERTEVQRSRLIAECFDGEEAFGD
ncbi:transposase, partial [Candidatus Endoriftia persephone str. Guaymas]|nr:transposase [Candidatus Endoriftia persephone str. Guaymas]